MYLAGFMTKTAADVPLESFLWGLRSKAKLVVQEPCKSFVGGARVNCLWILPSLMVQEERAGPREAQALQYSSLCE